MKFKLVGFVLLSFLLLTACQSKDKDSESMEDMKAVYFIQGDTKFHERDCRYVRSNQNVDFMPKSEAEILGYEPCFLCRP